MGKIDLHSLIVQNRMSSYEKDLQIIFASFFNDDVKAKNYSQDLIDRFYVNDYLPEKTSNEIVQRFSEQKQKDEMKPLVLKAINTVILPNLATIYPSTDQGTESTDHEENYEFERCDKKDINVDDNIEEKIQLMGDRDRSYKKIICLCSIYPATSLSGENFAEQIYLFYIKKKKTREETMEYFHAGISMRKEMTDILDEIDNFVEICQKLGDPETSEEESPSNVTVEDEWENADDIQIEEIDLENKEKQKESTEEADLNDRTILQEMYTLAKDFFGETQKAVIYLNLLKKYYIDSGHDKVKTNEKVVSEGEAGGRIPKTFVSKIKSLNEFLLDKFEYYLILTGDRPSVSDDDEKDFKSVLPQKRAAPTNPRAAGPNLVQRPGNVAEKPIPQFNNSELWKKYFPDSFWEIKVTHRAASTHKYRIWSKQKNNWVDKVINSASGIVKEYTRDGIVFDKIYFPKEYGPPGYGLDADETIPYMIQAKKRKIAREKAAALQKTHGMTTRYGGVGYYGNGYNISHYGNVNNNYQLSNVHRVRSALHKPNIKQLEKKAMNELRLFSPIMASYNKTVAPIIMSLDVFYRNMENISQQVIKALNSLHEDLSDYLKPQIPHDYLIHDQSPSITKLKKYYRLIKKITKDPTNEIELDEDDKCRLNDLDEVLEVLSDGLLMRTYYDQIYTSLTAFAIEPHSWCFKCEEIKLWDDRYESKRGNLMCATCRKLLYHSETNLHFHMQIYSGTYSVPVLRMVAPTMYVAQPDPDNHWIMQDADIFLEHTFKVKLKLADFMVRIGGSDRQYLSIWEKYVSDLQMRSNLRDQLYPETDVTLQISSSEGWNSDDFGDGLLFEGISANYEWNYLN